jgi:hypothetical protein
MCGQRSQVEIICEPAAGDFTKIYFKLADVEVYFKIPGSALVYNSGPSIKMKIYGAKWQSNGIQFLLSIE